MYLLYVHVVVFYLILNSSHIQLHVIYSFLQDMMFVHPYRSNRFNLFPHQGIEPSYLATETPGSYLFIFLAGSFA